MPPLTAHRDDLPRILDEIRTQGDLGANPQAIERLHRLLDKERLSTLGLAHAILQDPGMSAKVLRVVNSVAYSVRGEPVSTITRAIVLIGFDRVREIATGLLLIEQFTRGRTGDGAVQDNLRRALRCALTAQAVAVRIDHVAPEQAYLLGLFANLGLLWLAAYYPRVLSAALELERAGTHDLDQAIVATAGVAPARIAEEVLRHWHLPDAYVQHFRPKSGLPHTASGFGRLSAVVDLADAHARAVECGAVLDEQRIALLARDLDLSPHRLREAFAAADDELPAHARLLGLAAVSRAARSAAAGSPCEATADTGTPPPPATKSTEDANANVRTVQRLRDDALAIDVAREIGASIMADGDVNHSLIAIVEGIARAGAFDVVVLGLVSAARDRLDARFAYGIDLRSEGARFSVSLRAADGLLAEAARGGSARVVEHGAASLLVPAGAPAPRVPATSLLVQPLVIRGSAIGVVAALRTGAPDASRDDLPIVQMFCNLACICLQETARKS